MSSNAEIGPKRAEKLQMKVQVDGAAWGVVDGGTMSKAETTLLS